MGVGTTLFVSNARSIRRSFALIAVEHQYVDEKRRLIRSVLEENGYVRAICWDSDDGYVKRSLVGEGGELEGLAFDARLCSKKKVSYRCKDLDREVLCSENELGDGRYCDEVWKEVQRLHAGGGVCTKSGADYHSFLIVEPYELEVETTVGYDSSISVELGDERDGYLRLLTGWCERNKEGIRTGLELEECVEGLGNALKENMKAYAEATKKEALQ